MTTRTRALVTGGSSGLGASLVAALVARGDEVLVCDLVEPPSSVDQRAPASEPPVVEQRAPATEPPVVEQRAPASDVETPRASPTSYLHLDVRSDDDWAAALTWVTERWGGLDLLVNNAGVAGGGRIDVATMDEWEWITAINLFGVVRGCRTFAPMLKEQGSGRIVNVASLAGLVHPAGMASYNAVKAGVVALSETLGHELAGFGVGVSVVCPSYFRTNLLDSMQGADTALSATMGRLVDNAPDGPDEIAAAVLAGVEAGDELILPDDAARAAYALKQGDRSAYDTVMRKQAARLEASARG